MDPDVLLPHFSIEKLVHKCALSIFICPAKIINIKILLHLSEVPRSMLSRNKFYPSSSSFIVMTIIQRKTKAVPERKRSEKLFLNDR